MTFLAPFLPQLYFKEKFFFRCVKNSERRRFNKTSDYLSPEEEGVGWGGVGLLSEDCRGSHGFRGELRLSLTEYKRGGRTIYYCLLVRGWGGIRILQSLRGGSDKFFCDKTQILRPPPPPLPPPTSSPALDKTGPWVGRDDNRLKALFQIKDQRKYCPAYIPKSRPHRFCFLFCLSYEFQII